MHFCADELRTILMVLPFVGVAFAWVRARLSFSALRSSSDCSTDTHGCSHESPDAPPAKGHG